MTYVVISGRCRVDGVTRERDEVLDVDPRVARRLRRGGNARAAIADHPAGCFLDAHHGTWMVLSDCPDVHPIDHDAPAQLMCRTTFGAPTGAAEITELVPDPLPAGERPAVDDGADAG